MLQRRDEVRLALFDSHRGEVIDIAPGDPLLQRGRNGAAPAVAMTRNNSSSWIARCILLVMAHEHTGHAVHLLNYHLVWYPKYHRSVLEGAMADRLRAQVGEIAAEHGWTVLDVAVQTDHVHLFVRCRPTDSPHRIVRAFKGRTSRVLRSELPSLRRRLPTLWTRSHFVDTTGNVAQAPIQRPIAAQKGV